MSTRKRIFLCAGALLCVCLLAATFFEIGEIVRQAAADWSPRRCVILDAGHGGFDGGAVAADGTVEKDINLHITLKLYDFLALQGYDVILTRSGDEATDDPADSIRSRKVSDLKNRLALMQAHPDGIFVSIHLNKFTTSSATGAQVFYAPPTAPASKQLGEQIQRSIVFFLQPDNRRVVKQGSDSTYLLSHAPVPAVIVECGFLSNPKELALLKTDAYQSRMAFSVFCGVFEYLREGADHIGR